MGFVGEKKDAGIICCDAAMKELAAEMTTVWSPVGDMTASGPDKTAIGFPN